LNKPLAIVTGGSSGIGRCLVESFARAGYAVAFSFISDDSEARELVRGLEASGQRAFALEADAGDRGAVERFLEAASGWHGAAPNVLINNAGIQTWSPLLELSDERWNAVLRTNLTGCFINTQAVARRMVAAGQGGSIINIGSGCNKLAFPNLVDYTASKGGIEQFTKSAAIELGPHGITVNCIAPGAIATERTAQEQPDYAAAWSPLTPLRRVGTPADVADVALFFASPAARFVSGQTLWVDGGLFTRAAWPTC
jgi:3-oxoacyl-[acyl-carrier protein] reductase